MTTVQLNNEKLKSLEEKIGVAEHRRDIARQRGMNNLADKLSFEMQTLMSEWDRIFSESVNSTRDI